MTDFSNKNLIEQSDACKREEFNTVIFCVVIILLAVIFLYLKIAVFTAVSVSQTSMNPTLNDGDFLVAVKTDEPRRGDIIILNGNDKVLIKRVVGIEGDVLWTEGGYLYRETVDKNGKNNVEKLTEDYVLGKTYGIPVKITVPKDCVYVLGDNRQNSVDSRELGAIKLSDVVGVVPSWSVAIKDTFVVRLYKKILGF